MSVFIQKLNPVTGLNDWVVQNEDYDYHQEVARAAFADMLHDTERNQLYEKALKAAIEKMHSRGKEANVLDIGTGTGLLSMMAVRNGADSVAACEAFQPMSKCAVKIIDLNGMSGKIQVIPKRSTDLKVGSDGDLPKKCNILVTEVFDTELIGEGALSTFDHAHKNLLEKDCIVVPESATIYAQVVECPIAQDWNKLKNIFDNDGDIVLKIPENVRNCAGSAAIHDIQLSQLPITHINTIVSPLAVLRFDWSGRTPFVYERSTINSVKAEQNGKAQAVFMWWDLQMDTEGEHILSCAPYWEHPLSKNKKHVKIPWRDHWMQAIYYLPKEIPVKKGQEINLMSCHDEYSLWFNLTLDLRISNVDYLNPVCECGLHVAFSRTRIGQINDTKRTKVYLGLIEKYVTDDSVVLLLSSGFYSSLAAVKCGAKKLYFLETNPLSRRVLNEIIKHNCLTKVEVIENAESLAKKDVEKINLVLAEPYYCSSILPWDNLLFLYLLRGFNNFLSSDVKIFPKTAIIKGMALKFDDLHKIRMPLGSCEGFLMKHFDDLIQESTNISDDNVEAQPLWEYPGIALSKQVEIVKIDLVNVSGDYEINGTFDIEADSECNGIALWVDWCHEGTLRSTITTGPVLPTEIGSYVQWDMHTRQGVYLFPNRISKRINFSFKFNVQQGNITFTCR